MDHIPKGVTKKKKGRGFGNKFGSTILGTALFVAEMQKKVPLRTKLLVLALLLAMGGVGGYAWWRWSKGNEAKALLTETLEADEEGQTATLRGLLTEGHLDDDGRIQAYRRLADLRDTEAVPFLIEGLTGSDEEPRVAALALARIGSPGADAARSALTTKLAESADEQERLAIAWALVRLHDGTATDAVLAGLESGRLQELEGYDAGALADLLGRAGLLEALSDERSVVRHFGAEHLGPLCDPSIEPSLTAAIQDADSGVRLAATVSLAQCGTPSALQTAAGVLARESQLRTPARVALEYAVGAPGLGLLMPLAENNAAKLELLTLMRDSADPRVAEVIAAELARTPEPDAQLRLGLLEALTNVSSNEAVPLAMPLLDMDDDWSASAVRTLGQSDLLQDVELTLATLLRRSSLRGPALLALTTMGGCGEETQAIARRSGETPERLRYQARCTGDTERAFAIVRRGGEQGRVNTRDGALRLAGYHALANGAPEGASEAIYEMVIDATYDQRLRTAAAHTLGAIADDVTRTRLLDKALDPGIDQTIRNAAWETLRHQLPRSGADRLMGYLRTGADDARTLTSVELLTVGGPALLEEELRDLLEDERARTHAAVVLSFNGSDEDTITAITRLLASDVMLAAEVSRRARQLHFYIPVRTFQDGRFDSAFLARTRHLLALRDAGLGDPLSVYVDALKENHDLPGVMTALQVRRALERTVREGDDATRMLAANLLYEMGHRGFLLAHEGAGQDEIAALLRH